MDDEQAETNELPVNDDAQAETNQLPVNDDAPTQANVAPTALIPDAEEGPSTDAEAASLHDLATTAGSFARARLANLRSFVAAHRWLITAVVLLAIAAILGMAYTVGQLADMPDVSVHKRDAQDLLSAPAYSGGSYGSTEQLVLSNFEVTGRHKEASQPNECLVSGVASFSNGAVEALQEAQLSYVRLNGSWKCTGVEAVGGTSYTALSGVSTDRVLANVSSLLQRAESSLSQDQGGTALPALYSSAQASVTEEAFDGETQTDVVTLHLVQQATFTSYECDLRATFAFRPGNGLWELTAATSSANAKDLTLSPLTGAWSGSFLEQSSTDGKCFGAKDQGLRVYITSAADGRIAGTVSGLAHYHGDVADDVASSEGDTAFEDVLFSGTLQEQGDGITFACTMPEDAGGTMGLTLVFGTQEDPSAARATLSTTHSYEASWLIFSYGREATFSDTFALTRE